MTIEFLLEDLSISQIRAVQRQSLPAFAIFQVPTDQNNQYTKATYFGVACPELLPSYFELTCSATLQ